MQLRSFDPQNENLSQDVRSYLDNLKAIGLVTYDGSFKATTTTNPRVHDNIRMRLLPDETRPSMTRLAAGPTSGRRGSINPTVVLPKATKPRTQGRSKSRGRGIKRGARHEEEEIPAAPAKKRQRKRVVVVEDVQENNFILDTSLDVSINVKGRFS